jgi:hypothetical protein
MTCRAWSQAGCVVEDPEVRRRQPPAQRLVQLAAQERQRLRRLHLHLEPQPHPELRLQLRQHARELPEVGLHQHLGNGHREPARQLTGPLHHPGHEAAQRAHRPLGIPVGERLHPGTPPPGQRSGRVHRGDRLDGLPHVAVLDGAGPHAVPVLEVDAQILDRLGGQLAQ